MQKIKCGDTRQRKEGVNQLQLREQADAEVRGNLRDPKGLTIQCRFPESSLTGGESSFTCLIFREVELK